MLRTSESFMICPSYAQYRSIYSPAIVVVHVHVLRRHEIIASPKIIASSRIVCVRIFVLYATQITLSRSAITVTSAIQRVWHVVIVPPAKTTLKKNGALISMLGQAGSASNRLIARVTGKTGRDRLNWVVSMSRHAIRDR